MGFALGTPHFSWCFWWGIAACGTPSALCWKTLRWVHIITFLEWVNLPLGHYASNYAHFAIQARGMPHMAPCAKTPHLVGLYGGWVWSEPCQCIPCPKIFVHASLLSLVWHWILSSGRVKHTFTSWTSNVYLTFAQERHWPSSSSQWHDRRSNTHTGQSAGGIHMSTFVILSLFHFYRPLPSEMVRYAREDTHYLLYICDRLHNELIKSGNANSNLLQSVFSRSKDICLKVCIVWLFVKWHYF